MATVLTVSSSVKFFGQFKAAAELTDSEILTATSMSEAKKYLMLGGINSVVINCPVCDGFGFDEAEAMADTYGVGILLFVKQELFEDVSAKFDRFDIITVMKPCDREAVRNAAKKLIELSPFTQSVAVTAQNSRLTELKMISRAKILLMRQFSMNEAEAHRYIEKRAMDTGHTKAEIAYGIIKSYKSM